jgi:broad specificity phosphatase PhoE
MKTTIHFIRHGSVVNPDNILYGRLPDFPLNSQGVMEAGKAAVGLQNTPLEVIYTSPMLRARQTAEAIHAFHDTIPVITSDKLNEVFTPYQGMKAESLRHLNEDFYTGTQKPYEQPADIVERVQDFIWEVRKQTTFCEVAAVTHGDIIVFFVSKMKGLGLVPGDKARLTLAGMQDNYPATASITTMTYFTESEDEEPMVEYCSGTREIGK